MPRFFSQPIAPTGLNESKARPFTADDVRYTTKGGAVYAILLGAPKADIHLKSLGTSANLLSTPIKGVILLGSGEKLQWSQTADG